MKKKPPRKTARKAAKPAPKAKPPRTAKPKPAASETNARTNARTDERTPVKRANNTRNTRKPRAVIDRKAAFLKALAVTGRIGQAAKAAGVDRGQHYDWIKADPDYHARFLAARERAGDALEDEAVERAMQGVYEPNIFQGRFLYPQEEYVVKPEVRDAKGRVVEREERGWRDVPGSRPLGVWKKSDMLLLATLRAAKPERYRQTGAFELTGPGGGPIEIVERLNAARSRMAALKNADEPSIN